MRHWYVALNQSEQHTVQFIKKMMSEPYGYDLDKAAYYANVSMARAQRLLSRAKITPAELKAKRKDYIVAKMTAKEGVHRNSTYVTACFFDVEESYVLQLVKELRSEGRLPPPSDDSPEWQEEILGELRKEYPNVFRARTVGKEKEYPNMIFCAGPGWITWDTAKKLVAKNAENKKAKLA